MSNICIYGASGHAKVIWDALSSVHLEVQRIVDDNPDLHSFLGRKLAQRPESGDEIIVAIGDNNTRKVVVQKLSTYTFFTAIHQTAYISDRSEVGVGVLVAANAVINPSSKVYDHCIINTAAVVEHDCVVHDFAHISPNATLCGGVSIGAGTHIGAGAVILPNIKIGAWCRIGAGAVIIKDIPDGATVVGNPGRTIS